MKYPFTTITCAALIGLAPMSSLALAQQTNTGSQATPGVAGQPAAVKTARAAPSAPAAKSTKTGANQFTTVATAAAHCPADTVVWVNLSTKVYHFAGSKNYGATKRGAYMCEKDATPAKFHAAKGEKKTT